MSTGDKLNVLWLMTDEQRSDSLGIYGSPWAHTPNLDRLARDGTVFRNAVTPSPVCIPARTSLLTGLYPGQLGVWQNAENPHAVDTCTFLTSAFAEAGYATASFGKQHYYQGSNDGQAFEEETDLILTDRVHYTSYGEGFDIERFEGIRFDGPTPWILGGRFPGDMQHTSEAAVVRQSLRWLEERPAE